MKYVLFFIAILCTTLLGAQNSNYAFKDGSLWSQHLAHVSSKQAGQPPVWNHDYLKLAVFTDSIQSEFNYQNFYSYSSDWKVRSLKFSIKYINKNAFYRKLSDTTWAMLYDYNLNVGDSFDFHLGRYSPYVEESTRKLAVVKTDSVLIDNNYRKRIEFQNLSSSVKPIWVEGMGDPNYGIITDYGKVVNFKELGGYGEILCYNYGNKNIIGNCYCLLLMKYIHGMPYY